jgi:hypothetical protein
MQFTVPIPHATAGTVISVDAVCLVQAKAKAYRIYADAERRKFQVMLAKLSPFYVALSQADKPDFENEVLAELTS